MKEALSRLYRGLDTVTENALAIMLAVMVANVALNVFTRYVFYLPIIWAEEFARYIMIWFAFFGMSLAVRDNDHVFITIVKDSLPPFFRRAVELLIDVLVLVFLVVLLIQAIKYMDGLGNQTTPAMSISMRIPYFSVLIGAILMGLQQIKRAVLTFQGGER